MANPGPLTHKKIVKKHKGTFKRFVSGQFKRVKASWRQPRGIDNRFRRQFKGTALHVKIGYGSDKATKYLLPNGFYKFVVNNVQDLELLLMHNKTYCAEIAHTVSRRKRIEIVKRAEELNVKVINAKAKLSAEEN